MSALGQKRTSRDVRSMSALLPIATLNRPKAEMTDATNDYASTKPSHRLRLLRCGSAPTPRGMIETLCTGSTLGRLAATSACPIS